MKIIQISVLLLIVAFISSCSTVKRNGMYQTKRYSFGKSAKHLQKKYTAIEPIEQESNYSEVFKDNFESTGTFEVTKAKQPPIYIEKPIIQNETISIPKINKPRVVKALLDQIKEENSDSCDLIVFKNGDEVEGKVTEISNTQLKYKRCNNLSGPSIIAEKADVLFVKYVNGTKDVFATESTKPQTETQIKNDTSNGANAALRVVGTIILVIGILFVLFVSILGGLIIAGIGLIFMSLGKKG